MTSKSRGYLLVDLSIALSIFSILSFGIFTFYRTYKRIDKDNKKKIECLNYIDYISMELKYNLDFSILERRLDKEYILDIANISSINELIEKGELLIESIEEIDKTINDNHDLNGYYMILSIVNESSNNSINKDILNIKVRFMENKEECIYENIIKKYRYIL